jgi:hypothetical protein
MDSQKKDTQDQQPAILFDMAEMLVMLFGTYPKGGPRE